MKYFLKLCLILIVLSSCNNVEYYKRPLTPSEKSEYAGLFASGSAISYQGTPDFMMVVMEAIQLDSTNGAAWRERGIPFLKRGFGIDHERYYAKARQYDPDWWSGGSAYNYLYFYRDYKKAIQLFNEFDTLTPNFVDYPQAQNIDMMRGLCHLKLGQLEEAKSQLRKYIQYETAKAGREYVDARGFLYLGIALMEEENFTDAVATLKEGLSIDRNNAEMLLQLSKCFLSQNDKVLALQTLDQVEVQLANGNQFTRDYVDEFYQVHQGHIDDLRSVINHKS